MRTNYVLIDFESVQPKSLTVLDHEHFKVYVFVGTNQNKVPFDLAAALQRLGANAEYIKITGNGPNALDFHIAYYIGRFAVEDPDACFLIISKDTGFDPLVQHLKSQKIFASRVKTVDEIPFLKVAGKSAQERVDVVIAKLQTLKSGRPRTLKTLTNTIDRLFHNQLREEEIAHLVKEVQQSGVVTVSGNRVSYELPENE